MAEEEIKEKEEQEKSAVEKDSKKKLPFLKWIIMAVVIVILGAAGFGGWWYYRTHSTEPPEKEVGQTVQVIKTAVWPIESIIVNLLDNNGERYLKITIQLEISNEDCISELDTLKPEIMDSLLDLLSSKKYNEIVGFDGKQRLRDEIAIRLNNYLDKGQITKVYFTEFIIQ